ncbi:2(OG)-Fe(II) oxygenase superfamily protein [Nitzschia inconspicua]|uniref:2(OG)-Fe(II) oxygenase superfamily protein n=1 Tax=Nitzschia inconspicua TaxID=303405 RepID=A0A9K3PZ20_9STRA|nr:2(OG)-Fe(II) oxygenase superfamily protein [Nitzschia inconspicua]
MKITFPLSLGVFLTVSQLWMWLLVKGQHPGHLVVDVLPLKRPTSNNQDCEAFGNDDGVCFSNGFVPENSDEVESMEAEQLEEEDPMLEEMPGYNFKAYKRADISSFYNEPPGSRVEATPSFQGQAAKFQNMSPERLDLIWDAGSGAANGNHICSTGPFESCGTSSFATHVFYFVRPKTMEVVCTFQVVKEHSTYYCDPFVANDAEDESAGELNEPLRSIATLSYAERKLYEAAQFNRDFAPVYKNFTGGNEWLGQFPTQKPQHFMWRADYFGQEHHVSTKETHFVQLPPQDRLKRLSIVEMKRENSTSLPLREWREDADTLNLTLTVISVAPRIIQIDNFLSDIEVDHILETALKKNLQRSTTGMGGADAHVSSVRTSRTTWLSRHTSPILDAIIRRGADVMKIDEALMRHRLENENGRYPHMPNKNPINEDLQIVHYDQGQQYTAHHDFGYPDTRPNAPSRSINLCMYLNEGMEGGETSFPRWRRAKHGGAVKAVPKKGKAMIFYMRLPDGNLDDLSQHAAMPVLKGEKWFANLWTWDPYSE